MKPSLKVHLRGEKTQTGSKKESTGESLMRLVRLGKRLQVKAPADLSSRIDDYLYVDGMEQRKQPNTIEAMKAIAQWANDNDIKAPTDLSEKHDEYAWDK